MPGFLRVRARLPVPCEPGINQLPVVLGQDFGAQSQAFHHPLPKWFDQDIGLLAHPSEYGCAFRMLQVQRYGLLSVAQTVQVDV